MSLLRQLFTNQTCSKIKKIQSPCNIIDYSVHIHTSAFTAPERGANKTTNIYL